MKLRPRLDALEAKRKPSPDLMICSTPEEAQQLDKPAATVIITGVPRPPEAKP